MGLCICSPCWGPLPGTARESQFRRHADLGGVRAAAESATTRALVWAGLSLRLWLGGAECSALLAVLAVLTSTAYLAVTWLARR